MSQTPFSNTASQGNNGQAEDILRQEDAQIQTKNWWWQRITMPSEMSGYLSFAQREALRRARLLSTMTFFLLLVDLFLIPASLFVPNHSAFVVCSFALLAILVAMLANRANHPLFASIWLVSALELALIAIIASNVPFDVGNLPLYDLLIIAELFAASLLPAPALLVIALLNSLFVTLEVLLLRTGVASATPALHAYLQNPFHAVLVRPVALQIIVGVMSFLWVRSTSQAIARANRAEMIAQLEHALAQQKEELEEDIQRILQTYAEVSNGNFDARTPIAHDHALWPLANAFNTLLTRFQRASKAEQEMQRFQRMIPSLVHTLKAAEQSGRPVPTFSQTSTSLDPLLSCLSGKKVVPLPPQDVPFRN